MVRTAITACCAFVSTSLIGVVESSPPPIGLSLGVEFGLHSAHEGGDLDGTADTAGKVTAEEASAIFGDAAGAFCAGGD
jgi:hypothetical protein